MGPRGECRQNPTDALGRSLTTHPSSRGHRPPRRRLGASPRPPTPHPSPSWLPALRFPWGVREAHARTGSVCEVFPGETPGTGAGRAPQGGWQDGQTPCRSGPGEGAGGPVGDHSDRPLASGRFGEAARESVSQGGPRKAAPISRPRGRSRDPSRTRSSPGSDPRDVCRHCMCGHGPQSSAGRASTVHPHSWPPPPRGGTREGVRLCVGSNPGSARNAWPAQGAQGVSCMNNRWPPPVTRSGPRNAAPPPAHSFHVPSVPSMGLGSIVAPTTSGEQSMCA